MKQPLRNGKIKIDHNIPIPDNNSERGMYPIDEMEVGDSFLYPKSNAGAHHLAFVSNKKHPDRRFISKKTDRGMRIWRTK
jgi:hypothetical protein